MWALNATRLPVISKDVLSAGLVPPSERVEPRKEPSAEISNGRCPACVNPAYPERDRPRKVGLRVVIELITCLDFDISVRWFDEAGSVFGFAAAMRPMTFLGLLAGS